MSDSYEREVGYSLMELAADVDEFTRHRVPQDRDAPARKCAAEAAEFAQNPSLDEAADVLITLLGWVTSNDHPIRDWLDVAHQKMQVNLRRTWVQQADGTWQHVEDLVAARDDDDDESADRDVETVARQVLAMLAEDLGECQWQRVVQAAARLAPSPTGFTEAYERLAGANG